MNNDVTPLKRAGWSWIYNSAVDHYFVDGRSLCGKWMCFGSDFIEKPKKTCAACARKPYKLKAERNNAV